MDSRIIRLRRIARSRFTLQERLQITGPLLGFSWARMHFTKGSVMEPRIRIGAVNYLNSKPLIEDLEELAPEAELVLDFPSRLADRLTAGTLDVGLVPSIACLLEPDYEVVSDACVAARGPVLSVKLYFRKPPRSVRRLALDAGSRTSAALAQILLAERFGIHPQLEPLPL